MSIKKRDGSAYSLQKVNPLMKDQNHWKGEWTLHNVQPQEVVIKDPHRVIPEGTPEEAPIISMVGVGFVPQTEILYCLPMTSIIDEDPVYGTKKRVVSWGEKFSFEAVKVDSTGLTATFFARIPQDLEPGSIVFVFRERQWWKVGGTRRGDDGVDIYCVPSEVKPSFV